MKCLDCQKQISALIDGELPETFKTGLEHHLQECSSCSNYYQRMVSANSQVRALAAYSVDPFIAEKVKERIGAARNRSRDYRPFPLWGRIPAFATLIILAIGLGNFAGTSLFEILNAGQAENLVELLVQDNVQSFGDLVMEIGPEENVR
jgi:anti-sigma factor RsiW